MRIKIRAAVGIGAVVLAVSMPALSGSASATSGPPWEQDPNTTTTGTLTFYNAAGTVVTGGSDLSHLFDYAQASSTDPSTKPGTLATLYFANPTPGTATGNWPIGQAAQSQPFPNSSAPSPLTTSPDPVSSVSQNPADDEGDLANFIASHTVNSTTGYVDIYQIRVTTSKPGGGGTGNSIYWDADISVDPTAGTWVETYPVQGAESVATTTTLAAAPATTASQHSSVTLTATVTATNSTNPAGSVEFFQDGESLGLGTFDAATGIATLTTSALLPSAPSGTMLTATFTPSDTSSYAPSTSSNLAYTVNPTALKPSISGPHQVGGTEKCTESGLDFGVTASYSWLVAGKSVATGSSYKVAAAEYKKALSCSASVHDGAGPSSSATSNAVTVSLGKALKDTKAPKLSGAGKAGKTEKVNHGTWSPTAKSYTYQWLLNGKKIKHATKASYKLIKKDKGKKISCTVTATTTGYAAGNATSKAVKVKS